jgi:Uma2 family endonuclease
MTARASRLPTFDELYAEIEALPEGVRGEILEPGVIHTIIGRPERPHRYTFKRALGALGRFDVDQHGAGWWIEPETEVRFGQRMLDPDLAGWRVERVPEMPDDNPIAILPDWTCEILSPSTARTDRLVKLPRYAKEGVPWVWLVDPLLHTIEVYETEKGRPSLAMTAEADDTVMLPPFDGEIAVGTLWLPASPPPGAKPPQPVPPKGKRIAKTKR